jgi:VWFA-related protein
MSFRGPTLPALLLGAFCCVPSGAQTPEVVSREAPVTFTSRVNLVSVPVVVRDRDGRALGNLRQQDFQLFDRGKLQVITKFSVEKSGAATAVEAAPNGTRPSRDETGDEKQAVPAAIQSVVLPERYVAYLFDDIHLQIGDLLNARQAMNRHLNEALEPTARAAIFTTSGRMLSDFTDDREKLHRAVNSVQPWTGGPDPQQDCPPMTYYIADLLVNKLLLLDGVLYSDEQLGAMIGNGQADQALLAEYAETLACGVESAGGVPLTTNGGVPVSAGGNSIDAIRQIRTVARRVLTYGDRENTLTLGAIEDVVRRISVMGGGRTMVLVSPGFLLTRDHFSHEYAALDRAIRANVTVNTIDIRGINTTIAGGDAGSRPPVSQAGTGYLAQANISAAKQQQDVLGELADGTGGAFFHNDNGLKEGLNLLAARPEYVYVLGFSPQNLKFDGSFHNLKVTVKNAGNLTLQFRRRYWTPNHATDPAEEAREEIREAVFSRDEIQDIPVDLQTEFFKSSETTAELTVVTHLDLKGLRFRRADDRNNDTLTVVTGLFDSNGNFVNAIEKVVELHLRDQTLAAMLNTRVAMNQSFNIVPGRYVVRVVVRDAEGKTMSARNGGVEIP